MKKIILILTVAFLSIILTACADRTPFKEQEALKDTALVYVYIAKTVSTDDDFHDAPLSIKIDDKTIIPKIMQNEYVAYNLKPRSVTISAIKGAVLSQEIKLDLKPSKVYYLRVKNSSNSDSFTFEKMNQVVGLQEIAKTTVAGSNFIFKDNDKVEGLVETTPDNKATRTKADEIQRLYDMKEKGILSQEEFETLKAKVIKK